MVIGVRAFQIEVRRIDLNNNHDVQKKDFASFEDAMEWGKDQVRKCSKFGKIYIDRNNKMIYQATFFRGECHQEYLY